MISKKQMTNSKYNGWAINLSSVYWYHLHYLLNRCRMMTYAWRHPPQASAGPSLSETMAEFTQFLLHPAHGWSNKLFRINSFCLSAIKFSLLPGDTSWNWLATFWAKNPYIGNAACKLITLVSVERFSTCLSTFQGRLILSLISRHEAGGA